MHTTLSDLIDRLNDPALSESNVIPWGSPVPSFGDLSRSRVATLGLNPSNREFVDVEGNELNDQFRRFHTLASLGLECWTDAKKRHLELIVDCCQNYFFRNPYDGWFKALDHLISGTNTSYYDASMQACHLDLIPYATSCKWTELSINQRSTLLKLAGDTLGLLLRDSSVCLLILNGQTVVNNFEEISSTRLSKEEMPEWTLPRRSGSGVMGYAYKGAVRKLAGVTLDRDILILGFNHNIQSSFGVTKKVKKAIQNWITKATDEANL